jgi:hypothetical protein
LEAGEFTESLDGGGGEAVVFGETCGCQPLTGDPVQPPCQSFVAKTAAVLESQNLQSSMISTHSPSGR